MRWQTLTTVGWTAEREQAFIDSAPGERVPGRVVRQDRGGWTVVTPVGELLADIRGRLRATRDVGQRPGVGDWVALTMRADEGTAMVESVLPRTSAIIRNAAGRRTEAQVLAANVDTAFICVPCDAPANPRRVERELAMVWESGAHPVVVLTKSDLASDLETATAWVQAAAVGARASVADQTTTGSVGTGPTSMSNGTIADGIIANGTVPNQTEANRTDTFRAEADVVAVNVHDDNGVAPLAPWLISGRTLVVIGPSGAGKSTLANALLNDDRLATGAVRDLDQRGRHTTSWRELVMLPSGAMLIDTPGIRELVLWGATEGVAHVYDDVDVVATRCRFADCEHRTEPGCAILAALADGTLNRDRYEAWTKLQSELETQSIRQDARVAADEKRKLNIAKAAEPRTRR